jgi:hypothetical protein
LPDVSETFWKAADRINGTIDDRLVIIAQHGSSTFFKLRQSLD